MRKLEKRERGRERKTEVGGLFFFSLFFGHFVENEKKGRERSSFRTAFCSLEVHAPLPILLVFTFLFVHRALHTRKRRKKKSQLRRLLLKFKRRERSAKNNPNVVKSSPFFPLFTTMFISDKVDLDILKEKKEKSITLLSF